MKSDFIDSNKEVNTTDLQYTWTLSKSLKKKFDQIRVIESWCDVF